MTDRNPGYLTPTNEWTHRIVGGPWPERIGKQCRVVPCPDGATTYPWTGRRDRKAEAVILVEDDPLRRPHETDEWHIEGYGAVWSCCISVADLVELNACYD